MMPDEVVPSRSPESSSPDDQARADQDRREFLEKCGRFAAITPPAVTLLLSTALSGKAIAASGGGAIGGPGHPGGGKLHLGNPGKHPLDLHLGNPGNNKLVGHAGEGPPKDSRFVKFGYNSSTGTGGSRGASDGSRGPKK
jgi:hypothetical protein